MMRGSDGRETPLSAARTGAESSRMPEAGQVRFPGRWDAGPQPVESDPPGEVTGDLSDDTLERMPTEPTRLPLLPLRFPGAAPYAATATSLHGHTRLLVRAFLGALQRSATPA